MAIARSRTTCLWPPRATIATSPKRRILVIAASTRRRRFSPSFSADPTHAASTATGELRHFDQKRFLAPGKDAFLANQGYAYLPKSCLAGKSCGVLVVFHGCKQNADAVGETFVRGAGFNRWADVYNVAVLYPQTRASFAPLNPQACWDWWGYSGAGYDTRQGVQQQWLRRALTALGVALATH